MQIYPAIDLRGGNVVRLYQGDYDRETVYAADPCAVAREFLAAGAKYLHAVDLDGARDGTAANLPSVAALTRQGGLAVEVGGGIRTEERIRQYLDLGAERCILGTVAVRDFDFTARMARRYGRHIAVGVDARDGFVAVSGWRELSAERSVDFCRRLAEAGVRTVIYTDISRDGAERGTNLAVYRELAAIGDWRSPPPAAWVPWRSCGSWQDMGIHAAILGKALYTGKLELRAGPAGFSPGLSGKGDKAACWQSASFPAWTCGAAGW
jgi:phosphoribosylformimino-5-aminoimidazole carboxamide ribotide isomerase